MKRALIHIIGSIILLLTLVSCERMNNQDPEIRFNSVFIEETLFSECVQNDSELGYGTIEIEAEPNGYLMFHAKNSEFCCDTDSLIIGLKQSESSIEIEVYDMGPYSYCFCDHDLFFSVGPFKEQVYSFKLIESVDAYRRDTFEFSLDLANFSDTILFPIDTTSTIIPQDTTIIIPPDTTIIIPPDTTIVIPPDTTIIDPPDTTWIPPDTSLIQPQYITTQFGGCNEDTTYRSGGEPDISYFTLDGDTAIIFAGFNYKCCAPFTSNVDIVDGIIIITLKDNCSQPYSSCYCRCSCYYTFEFKIKLAAPFRVYPYKIYVDNPKQGGEYLFWEDFISGPL